MVKLKREIKAQKNFIRVFSNSLFSETWKGKTDFIILILWAGQKKCLRIKISCLYQNKGICHTSVGFRYLGIEATNLGTSIEYDIFGSTFQN